MKYCVRLIICCLFVFFSSVSFSSVPGKLSYEGRLTDSAGNPITTAKTIEFRIYDALTGGSVVWGPESHSITPDSQGVFSASLGETVSMAAAVFSNATRYLELSVAGETLSPRSQIVASGYSFMSANSQGVEDGTITRAKAASGQFVKSIIAGSGVTVSGDEGSGTGNVTLTATGTGGGTGTVSQVNTGNGLTGGPITSTGTLAINTNIVVTTSDAQTLTNKTISGTNNSLTNLGISNLTIASQAQGDLVYFNGTSWTRLPAGTSGQLLKTNGAGADPSWAAAGGTGTVTQVSTGTGLTGGPVTTTGTISVDVGTSANKIVQLDSSAKLPAVDGSALTGLTKTQVGLSNVPNTDATNASNISTGTLGLARGGLGSDTSAAVQGSILYNDGSKWVALAPGTLGQILKTNGAGANPAWAAAGGTGTVTQVDTGNGLTGGPVTSTGIISVDAGTTANKIVQLDGSAKLPAVDGSALTGLTKTQVGLGNVQNVDQTNASNLSSGTVATARLGSGTASNATFLRGDQTWSSAGTGTVTQVSTGNGLTGGPVTTTGTISVDAGTTANKIVQLDGSAKLPAVDGSALTGLTKTQVGLGNVQNVDQTNASNITSGTLADARLSTNVVTSESTNTFKNKTISDADNTITLSAGTIPNLDASKITTGTIATARLGSGTASNATFLRGDQTWSSAGTGTVTQVSTGNGLTGGPVTSTGTISIDANVVVTTSDAQTLTNKTLTAPTIASFSNAGHDHSNAAGGGQLSHLNLTNIGTNTHAQVDTHIAASTNVHGLAAGSSVVGTTDAQTLTSKTLTSPIINTPTISGGTINNTTIGQTTPAIGRFTKVEVDDATKYIDTNGNNMTFVDAVNTTAITLSELSGWHGSVTRIKLLPSDFATDDSDDNLFMDQSGRYTQASGTAQGVATRAIPTGYKVTHVLVYGSDTNNAVTVRENDISNGTTATSLGTGTVGTEIDITDANSTATNYISIFVNTGNGDQIYGGYITISKI